MTEKQVVQMPSVPFRPKAGEATAPTVLILNDGNEYKLKYTLGTMQAMSEEFGGSFLESNVLASINETKLAKLIHYGLRKHHGNLTLEQLVELIDAEMIPYVLETFVTAFRRDHPKQ